MPLERHHVIASGIAAFIAWSLLTDWIPALRWIPYAFVAGLLAAALGSLYLILTTSRGTRRDEEVYADNGPLAPAFSTNPTVWEEERAVLRSRAEYRRPTIFPEAPAFSRAADDLLDRLLRDHVTSWYAGISSRPLFQHEIDRCLRSVLLTVAARFTEIDVVEVGVGGLLPMLTAHLKEFYEAERGVRGKDLKAGPAEGSEELDFAIAGKYREGRVHEVATALRHADGDAGRAQQQAYLTQVVGKVLPAVLPANMQTSRATTVLIREVVSGAVLGPLVGMLCDPDFWNQQIVAIGGPMLQDRKTVRRVRAALDQHAPASSSSSSSKASSRSGQFPRLRAHDNERQFERFIRAIRRVDDLSEARRVRSEIVSQIRRDAGAEGQDAVYLRRLESGLKLLDQKLTTLSATTTAAATNNTTNGAGIKPKLALRTPSSSTVTAATTARKQAATLREILLDAAGLGYFMEYMDRARLTRLVQFYLVVDGFRAPLEGDVGDGNADATSISGVADELERMDIAGMYEAYLCQPELRTAESALEDVREYLKGGEGGGRYAVARRAVLRTQTRVYGYMREECLGGFRKSDLFFKWLAIDDDESTLVGVHGKQIGSGAAMLSPLDSAGSSEGSPVKARRPQLGAVRREPELRRAVLSSSDLRTATRLKVPVVQPRRSLDDLNRPALFDDEVEGDRMMRSLTSLKEDESDVDSLPRDPEEEATAVREMQSALDDIVSHEQEDTASLFSDPPPPPATPSLEVSPPARPAEHQPRPLLSTRSSTADKPSLASLGLVGAPSTRGVFVDDLFAHETQRFVEDEHEDSNGPAEDSSDNDAIRSAAPGDLGLAEAIHGLSADVERLTTQRGVLDSLTAKAELTNNAAELRILRKSEQSLQREIRRKEMQRQQYAVQESDNALYGRAQATITSVILGQEADGHEYALYVIEVRKQAGDSIPAATWAVTRRYSQFHELHKRLRARFPGVKGLDFPRRQALFTLQREFIQRRRVALERYLRALLLVPAICRSRELRAFLSQAAIAGNGVQGEGGVDAKDFVTRIYESVSEGMEEFLGNVPVLDQLSVAGQNLISAASAQINNNNSNHGGGSTAIDALDPTTQDPATATEAEAELSAYEAKEAEPFVKPIADLFLETFELAKGNSWLRGRTVVVVLHQLLGGTIERKVRESACAALEDKSLEGFVGMLRGVLWPGGKARVPAVPRTEAQKARARQEAGVILGALVPDLAGSVVGRGNALAASRKVMAVVNNRRLNTHVVFTLLDEIVRIVFPETLNHKS
ncbi:tRNA (guanine-N(7)-)-methyltransferase (tRNA(m7G46)-methyltransferase) [Teratosphaeriaceae sp. CCFEE 6253]|nr:tRNA (guanine-N(7)-)-methyltransferase (tRNA(m7G46)-methyltransferase) [Teratosphaeriaceae sp. CCFEE 6253]